MGQERQRGANGRFQARERAEAVLEDEGEEKPLLPRQCGPYLRTELADQFRKIVAGFVKEAKNGGCAHMKLTAELLEPPKSASPRGKGSAQRMLEELGE